MYVQWSKQILNNASQAFIVSPKLKKVPSRTIKGKNKSQAHTEYSRFLNLISEPKESNFEKNVFENILFEFDEC